MKRIFSILTISFLLVSFACVAGASQKPVVFLDLSWDSAQVHNRIAGFIVEKGYGIKTDYLFSESLPGMLGLERGDVNLCMDTWVDNTPEWWRKAQSKKTVLNLGINYPEAPQGWYVPTYVIKGDSARGIEPMAPDLEYVEDLGKYWELFKDPDYPEKGRFYNAPPGWKISTINEMKLKSLGLDKFFVAFSSGSDSALQSVVVSSYKKGKPVVFYYWQPTALMGTYDMTLLKQRTPYATELWTEKEGYRCAFPSPPVLKIANLGFSKDYPELVPFIKNYNTTLKINDEILAMRLKEKLSLDDTVEWFLKARPEVWELWIPSDRQDVIDRVKSSL